MEKETIEQVPNSVLLDKKKEKKWDVDTSRGGRFKIKRKSLNRKSECTGRQ